MTGAVGREVECAEKIVGDALRELGDDVGRGRGNQQSVNRLGNSNVLDRRVEVRLLGVRPEQSGDDLLAGQRREGQRAHELLCRCGHDDLHAHSPVLQETNHLGRFVGGDAAAHAQSNSHDVVGTWPAASQMRQRAG